MLRPALSEKSQNASTSQPMTTKYQLKALLIRVSAVAYDFIIHIFLQQSYEEQPSQK